MKTNVSKHIRTRRLQLRVDQKTLARIAGISLHALSDLETGKGNPTLDTLDRVMNALGLQFRIVAKPVGVDDA